MKTVKSGYAWLDFAVNQMVETWTREIYHGLNIHMKRNSSFPVTSVATYVKCA
jgi:hypothetical protein